MVWVACIDYLKRGSQNCLLKWRRGELLEAGPSRVASPPF